MKVFPDFRMTPVIAAVVLLSSCSSGEQVSFDSGGLKHTFSAGKEAGAGAFPLPQYPGARSVGSVATQGDGAASNFLMLTSRDGVDKIAKFYEEHLKNDGWQIDSKHLAPELVNLSARKGTMQSSVMISSEGNSTSITLSAAMVPEGTPQMSDKPFVIDKLNPPTD